MTGRTELKTINTGKDLIEAAVLELAADAIPPTDSAIVRKIRDMHILARAQVEVWAVRPGAQKVEEEK